MLLYKLNFFQGVVKHLQFQSKELETYTEQLEKVLQRYIQRIQWLLSGIGVHPFFYKAQLKHMLNILVYYF